MYTTTNLHEKIADKQLRLVIEHDSIIGRSVKNFYSKEQDYRSFTNFLKGIALIYQDNNSVYDIVGGECMQHILMAVDKRKQLEYYTAMLVLSQTILELNDKMASTDHFRHGLKMHSNGLSKELIKIIEKDMDDVWGVADETLYNIMTAQKNLAVTISDIPLDLFPELLEVILEWKHFVTRRSQQEYIEETTQLPAEEVLTNMDKEWAKEAIRSGKKVSHNSFMNYEWVTMNSEGEIEFEGGMVTSEEEFWNYRQSEYFNKGWQLHINYTSPLENIKPADPERFDVITAKDFASE